MFANISRGVTWGLVFAAGFTALALLLQLFAGANGGWTGPPPFHIVIASYFAAGIVVGAVVGLLLPVASNHLGAALVGFIAALALAGTLVLIDVGSLALSPPDLRKILVLGAVWGPAGGIVLYWLFKLQL